MPQGLTGVTRAKGVSKQGERGGGGEEVGDGGGEEGGDGEGKYVTIAGLYGTGSL